MATKLFQWEAEQTGLRVCGGTVRLRTEEHVQLVDVTEIVAERVRRSGVGHGFVSVQTQHTTTAIVVNENEALLIADVRRPLERLVPGATRCQAALLGASVSLNVMEGRLLLGHWQRIFLVELDGPRPRSVSVVVMGASRERA
jgi:secondary thiamine-phosphate synthase enzyme